MVGRIVRKIAIGNCRVRPSREIHPAADGRFIAEKSTFGKCRDCSVLITYCAAVTYIRVVIVLNSVRICRIITEQAVGEFCFAVRRQIHRTAEVVDIPVYAGLTS